MRDILVLFGAGASYGAGGIIPERPPLGRYLYEELARIFPGTWGALPASIAIQFRGNFETGMATIYEKFGVIVPQLMREMAIYFTQFRPVSDGCLYRTFIRQLRSKGVLKRTIFSSLNYECTLETSLTLEGERFDYFNQHPKDGVPVWKLHGSCNFFADELHMSPDVSYGTGIIIEAGIRAFGDSSTVIQHCLVGTGLAPVMSLYMVGKPLAVSPSALAQIQKWWADSVASARDIVLIGVHPNPADTHLWLPLASSKSNLWFVGHKSTFESWASTREAPSRHLATSFSESIESLTSLLK